jgi:hypothetical protein
LDPEALPICREAEWNFEEGSVTQHFLFSLVISSLALAIFSSTSASAGPFNDAGYDPVLMLTWATDVDEALPGPMDIAMPELGVAGFGDPRNAVGPPNSDSTSVYSLGDGGSITLIFATGIADGEGDDFAVYENGFFGPGGLFAEFAFVDVSSDGLNYASFEVTSLRATVVAPFGAVDPTDYQNFAGDQPLNLGTGFDLAELANHPLVAGALLDLNDIRYVRLIDVIGDGSGLDDTGQPIYDPYPTAFSAGGFDIDAVGVLHAAPEPDSFAMLVAGIVWLVVASRLRPQVRQCAPSR